MSRETRVPEWLLERFLLGELPRRERRRLEQELASNSGLRSALEELKRSDRRILSSYPADQVIPQILKKAALARPAAATPRSRRLVWVAVPALALALLLMFVLPPLLRQRLDLGDYRRTGDYVGVKGDGTAPAALPRLEIFRRGPDGRSEMLADGGLSRAGDLLQLAYFPGASAHGMILSIDGAGAVTLHFPDREENPTALQRGRRVLLPRAYELDQAPRFERFFFVTWDRPLPAAAIMNKARQLAASGERALTAPLDLPGGYGQASLLIRKGEQE